MLKKKGLGRGLKVIVRMRACLLVTAVSCAKLRKPIAVLVEY